MEVILLGDTDDTQVTPAENAWELVEKLRREPGVEQSHHSESEKTRGGESDQYPGNEGRRGPNTQ